MRTDEERLLELVQRRKDIEQAHDELRKEHAEAHKSVCALIREQAADIDKEIARLRDVISMAFVNGIAPTTKGISARMEYDFEVEDIDKVKPKYLVPDKKAIREAVKSYGPHAEETVGGIKVFEKPILTVRKQ